MITRILATACAALLLSSPALAQQPAAPRGAVFPVASQMVWIDAVAVDSEDRPVPSLGPEDFEVVERGARQAIILFRPPDPEATGRAVVFLIEDAFARDWHVERARELISRAASKALAGDRILIVAPTSRVATSTRLPEAAQELQAALGALWGHAGPRAVVVMGPPCPYRADGPFGQIAYDRVMRASQQAAAPLYFLSWEDATSPLAPQEPVLGPDPGGEALGGVTPAVPMAGPTGPLGTLVFDAIGKDSGGFSGRAPTTWSWSLDRVFQRSRAAYLLGIPAARDRWDGRYHPLDVRVAKDGVRLYARKGYYAPRPETKAR